MQVNGTDTEMYKVKAVARKLDVHVATVYRLIERGQLHAARIGFGKGALRVPADSLNAYLKSVGMAPVPEVRDAEEAIA